MPERPPAIVKRGFPITVSFLAFAFAAAGTALAQPAPQKQNKPDHTGVITFESLLAEMTDLRALAEFPDPAYTCGQFSSYDRASTTPDDPDSWFANDDRGHFLRIIEREDRNEHVMMDAPGPGAVVRIWSANPAGTLRIYLDDSDDPVLAMPMQDYLSDSGPVGAPLAAVRSRGWNSYLPIPYAKRCVITCDEPDGLYYHINFRSYESATDITSFSSTDLSEKKQSIASAKLGLENPEVESLYRTRFQQQIEPGDVARIFEMISPGALVECTMRVDAVDLEPALRNCLLVFSFDGEETVRCPIGDFFGSAPGINPYQSFPMTVNADGSMNCRWFMPFAERGSIHLENRGAQPISIEGTIGTTDYDWTDRSMHFWCDWRASGTMQTLPRRDFTFASIAGKGVWIGDALTVANPVPAWWGEGDEKIYIDGEKFPSHFGTGTEDYYGYAWCDTETFSAPFHNQTRCDGPGNFGLTALNRFRMLDAIPFSESLRFDMEVWHWKDVAVSFAATSYFYARPGATAERATIDQAMLAIPDPELKVWSRAGAIEAENLDIIERSEQCIALIQILGDGSKDSWSAMNHVWCNAFAPNQSLTFRMPVENPGRYEVIAWLTRSFDYGIVQCAVNGEDAGERVDTFNGGKEGVISPPRPHLIGVFELDRDHVDVQLRQVGTNPAAHEPGIHFGVDCFELKRVDAAGSNQ